MNEDELLEWAYELEANATARGEPAPFRALWLRHMASHAWWTQRAVKESILRAEAPETNRSQGLFPARLATTREVLAELRARDREGGGC